MSKTNKIIWQESLVIAEMQWTNFLAPVFELPLGNDFDMVINRIKNGNAILLCIKNHGFMIIELLSNKHHLESMIIWAAIGSCAGKNKKRYQTMGEVIPHFISFCQTNCIDLIAFSRFEKVKKGLIKMGFEQDKENTQKIIYKIRGI